MDCCTSGADVSVTITDRLTVAAIFLLMGLTTITSPLDALTLNQFVISLLSSSWLPLLLIPVIADESNEKFKASSSLVSGSWATRRYITVPTGTSSDTWE